MPVLHKLLVPVPKLKPPIDPALLKHEQQRAEAVQNRIADRITAFSGSMPKSSWRQSEALPAMSITRLHNVCPPSEDTETAGGMTDHTPGSYDDPGELAEVLHPAEAEAAPSGRVARLKARQAALRARAEAYEQHLQD